MTAMNYFLNDVSEQSAKAGTVENGTAPDGTVKDGTVKAGTMKTRTGEGTRNEENDQGSIFRGTAPNMWESRTGFQKSENRMPEVD